MRMHRVLHLAATLALAGAPIFACAQFQAPTHDELTMTSEAKAPGADAIYLYYEEDDNDPLHYESIYARIKVLSEKGKSLATVELPYLKGGTKITDISGRTIHPDGSISQLTTKADDLLDVKVGTMQVKKKVFTLPNVEVGSILEYRYEIRYDDDTFSSPSWEVQKPYFVRKAHYSFQPFKAFMPGSAQQATSIVLTDSRGRAVNSLMYFQRLPDGASIQTDIGGHFKLDVADVPATPDDDWMPPINNYIYKVFFYYKAAGSAGEFWMDEAKLWQKDVNRFADPSKQVHETVNGLIAPTDSELDKAKKLYAAVQGLDNTDFSREKSASEMKELKIKAAKRAEDTWTQKSGSSEDIALLYLAMLRAAGITAYAMKAVDRSDRDFDIGYLDFDQLTDTLVVASIAGKEMLLDPGEKMCPFGTVSWKHSEVRGVRESSQGLSVWLTPPQLYTENAIDRTADLTVDEHGKITGACSIVMTGQAALHWRQLALENDMDEVKKQFDHDFEQVVPDGVEAHIDHFLAMDQPDSNLVAMVKIEGTVGTVMAKRILLPGFFFNTRAAKVPFVNQEKRLVSVDMHFAERTTNTVTYRFPAGVTVEGAPADNKILWAGHAVYLVKSQSAPGKVSIGNTEARGFALAKPEEYSDLRGFYQKVATANQEQLVLTETTAAASN
jgi:hypothetical protein